MNCHMPHTDPKYITKGFFVMPNSEYIAFISYRHMKLDMAVAKKIANLIEKYRVPKAIGNTNKRKLGVVFRDQDELPVSSDLSSDICNALDNSEYLIVICTPDTPNSIWVEREIEYYLKSHERSHVLAVLASGDPDKSFPYALTHIGDEQDTIVEPLAANICAETESKSLSLLSKEALRLFAAILGCPYDSLVRREQKRKQRRLAATFLSLFIILIGYVAILFHSNQLIETKNQELAAANYSLNEQKKTLQLTESSYLTAQANAALTNNEYVQAISYSIAALPKEEDNRPYYAPAEAVLMSALNVFDYNGAIGDITETNIELNSPVKTFYPTGSGDDIIVLDQYDALSSFNAYSGELNWRLPLSTVVSSPSFLLSDGEALISLDNTYKTIYALYDKEIFAINVDNGIVTWQTGDNHSYIQFTEDTEHNYLICLERISKGLYDVYGFDIVVLDAQTGYELQRCSFENDFSDGSPYRMSWEAEKEKNNTAFSENNKTFIGVIYATQNNVTQANYYSYDIENNELKIIYSESNNEYNIILWMALQDINNEQSLTIIKQSNENNRWLKIEIIDLAKSTLLYEADAKPKSDPTSYAPSGKNAVLFWKKDLLLVSAFDQLYLIKLSTGEVLEQTAMYDNVLCLYKIDPSLFGYVLADGTYELGWVSGYGFTPSSIHGATFNFGDITSAFQGNEGFIKPNIDGDSLRGFTAGDYNDGYGYIAVVDSSNERIIRVKHLAVIDYNPNDYSVKFDDNTDIALTNLVMDGLPLKIYNDGTLLFSSLKRNEGISCYTWIKYDPITNKYDTFKYEGEYFDSAWLIPKANKLVFLKYDGSIWCYNCDNTEIEKWGESKNIVIARGTLNEDEYQFWATVTKAKSVWNDDKEELITVQCDGESIYVWIDDKLHRQIDIPGEIVWNVKNNVVLDEIFELGENGYILLSDYSGNSSNHITNYALYNISNNTWSRIEDYAHGDCNRKFIMAAKNDTFAVYDQDMSLRIYSITDGNIIMTLRTSIAFDSVADVRYIIDDKYLALCSKDGMLEIFCTNDGSCVFSGMIGGNYNYCSRITAQQDNEEKRIYIFEHSNHIGLCFDAISWTKLGTIKNVYGFDAKTNRLCYNTYKTGIYLRYIPTIEEMVKIGQDLLE